MKGHRSHPAMLCFQTYILLPVLFCLLFHPLTVSAQQHSPGQTVRPVAILEMVFINGRQASPWEFSLVDIIRQGQLISAWPGMLLYPEDEVMPRETAIAIVRFTPEALVAVFPESRYKILNSGSLIDGILFIIEKIQSLRSRRQTQYQKHTLIQPAGTEFLMFVDDDSGEEELTVAVLEGSVSISSRWGSWSPFIVPQSQQITMKGPRPILRPSWISRAQYEYFRKLVAPIYSYMKSSQAQSLPTQLPGSAGSPTIVPDVVELHRIDAEAKIEAAGLQVCQVTEAESERYQQDIVTRQSPEAGSSVYAGSCVYLQIAVPAPIPDPCQVSSAEDSGPGSLRQILADVDSLGCSTITFAPHISKITLKNQLEIPAPSSSGSESPAYGNTTTMPLSRQVATPSVVLTIDGGASRVTISGNNKARAFWINSNGHVNFQNIEIKEGVNTYKDFDQYESAGIYNAGGIVVLGNNCLVTDNRHSGIINRGGKIVVGSGAQVNNNIGRAITNFGGNISIQKGAIIEKNTADMRGGGIYSEGGEVTIDGKISENTILGPDWGDGGGIYYQGEGLGDKLIINGTIEGNTADNNGGGIYIAGETKLVITGIVKGNKAAGRGGGLYIEGGRLIVEQGAVISDNAADIRGGGICLAHDGVGFDGAPDYGIGNKPDDICIGLCPGDFEE